MFEADAMFSFDFAVVFRIELKAHGGI
jgi:hypothetical protein